MPAKKHEISRENRVEAFLAIEDAQGRAALVTLAERMVRYDWVRKVQQC